ncbi:MAG TPA: VCBS domain-containing protein [Bradyrhizobium sp.]
MAGKFTDLLTDGPGSQPLGNFQVGSVSTHAPSDAIIVPDANLLFTGDFKRSGVDLILSAQDRELVLHDYFKGEKRAPLASPDGAHLTGDIVNALTGYTQYAQAGGDPAVAQVIGHVTKLNGNATAIRNGVSIILNQGDTVNKGDVVQSGSDSTLGITFIDGTVFGLASNAKMVLNEMVYDPNGSDNKSLLSLVQGTISFVAGATAKKGDMKVDTPVATMGIRGTAVLVEIDFEVPGQGAAPPAKFQVLVEPDGTTGSYILFDKTTLTPIATVNRAGTQTIINGQGGVSVQSSVQLSPDAQKIITDVFSLKFSDLNNPNTKLTTNFTDSIVPETFFVKTAANDFIPVTIQLVSVPGGPPPAPPPSPGDRIVHIPGPPQADAQGGAAAEKIDLTASPTLTSVSGIVNYVDVNAGDTPSVSAQFSTFTYKNAQQSNVTSTLTAEQLAAITAVEVPLNVVQDPNGKNIGAATWTYTVADGAFDFLAEGETLTLTYMARVDNNYAPNNETAFVPFTIVITGTNDKPTITASGGEITERIGTGHTEIDTVTGTVTFSDPDLTDRPVVTAGISTTDPFRYYDAEGNDVTETLTPQQLAAIQAVQVPLTVVQGAGNSHNGTASWTYSIADSAFDFIADGETLNLNYVAQVDDGHGGVISTQITVSIRGGDVVVVGTNDLPTIDATSDAFAELSNKTGSNTLHMISGAITFTDVDLTDRPVASAAFTSFTFEPAVNNVASVLTEAQLAAIAAVHAPLTVTQAAGNTNDGSASWSYSVPDSAFDFLAEGEALTLTYTATVDDGHGGVVTTPLTITVTGSNDAVEITSGAQAAAITEFAGAHGSDHADTASGSIKFADVDLTDTHEVTVTGVTASGVIMGLADHDTRSGWLTLGDLIDSTDGTPGSQVWTFSAPDHYFDYLADGETVTLTYTVQIDDHHGGFTSQDVIVTVTGTNDAPTVVTTNGAITEMAGTGNAALDHAGGSISFADLDLSDRPTVSASFAGYTYNGANGATGLSLTAQQLHDLGIALTLTPTGGNANSGSVSWSYDVADSQFDFLADGETLTLTYTATVDDHHGGLATRPVTVTITGSNDAPMLAAEVAGKLTDTSANDGFADITGTLDGSDADHGETASLSYAALDGSSAVNTAVAGLYGSLTVNANGTYTYVPNAAAINALHGGSYIDTFTVQTTDVHGAVATAVLTVEVTGANDTPTLAAEATGKLTDTAATDTFANITGTLDGSDRDSGDTATLSYGVVDAPGHVTNAAVAGAFGSLTVNSHGTYTYVPNAAAINALQGGSYTDTFTVQTTDVHGAVGTATLTVEVKGANDTPSIVGEVNPPAQIIVVAAPASPHVLAAGVNDNSLGLTTETFDSLTAGSSSNNGAGRGNFHSAALGADFSASGNAGIVSGSSSVTAAPYLGPAPGHQDTTKYLSIGGNATETITFASEKNVFGLYWGSVDSYNTIKFYDGNTLVAGYTGADISPLLSNGNQGSFASNGYVEFTGLHSFNKVVLSSSSNAFEIDNISAGYIPPPTLGPVTGTLSVHDADIGDTLTAFVTGNATIEYNGSTTMPGGVDISALLNAGNVTFDSMLSNGGTAVLQWTYHPINANLGFLHAGDVLKINFVAEVSDGHGHTGSQPLTVTLVGADSAADASTAGPVIGTDAFTVTELDNGVTKISGLYVTDADATASTGTFTVSAATGNVGSTVTPSTGTGPGIAGVNAALSNGIVYDPHSPQPQTDSVTLTVADSFGHTDRVHFIFNQGGTGPDVTLTGASGKDVIFASGHADTLTGGVSADQFVFAPEASPSADTITDFKPGEDHIDIRAFSFVDSSNIGTWLGTHAATSGADTLISLDSGDTITLKNVALASLHASDFIVTPHH